MVDNSKWSRHLRPHWIGLPSSSTPLLRCEFVAIINMTLKVEDSRLGAFLLHRARHFLALTCTASSTPTDPEIEATGTHMTDDFAPRSPVGP